MRIFSTMHPSIVFLPQPDYRFCAVVLLLHCGSGSDNYFVIWCALLSVLAICLSKLHCDDLLTGFVTCAIVTCRVRIGTVSSVTNARLRTALLMFTVMTAAIV